MVHDQTPLGVVTHLQFSPVDFPVGPLQLEVRPLVLYEMQYAGHRVLHLVVDTTAVAIVALLAETTARLLLLLLALLAAVVRPVVHVQ